MLTTKQRAFLRARATKIDATFQIGKGGVKETMLKSIEDALRAHEIVKIKCLENCEYTPAEAMEGISAALDAEQVQVIGNKIVLFKISPEHRRYDLDRLTLIEDSKAEKKGGERNYARPPVGAKKAPASKNAGKRSGRVPDFSSSSARTAASRQKPRIEFEVEKKKK